MSAAAHWTAAALRFFAPSIALQREATAPLDLARLSDHDLADLNLPDHIRSRIEVKRFPADHDFIWRCR